MTQMIRAYGDRKDDGRIQLSFTLPVAPSGRAKEAAKRFADSNAKRKLWRENASRFYRI